MLKAIETYLALRRATGFGMLNAAEIDHLIEAALRLRPKGGLRSWTYATLIALLSYQSPG